MPNRCLWAGVSVTGLAIGAMFLSFGLTMDLHTCPDQFDVKCERTDALRQQCRLYVNYSDSVYQMDLRQWTFVGQNDKSQDLWSYAYLVSTETGYETVTIILAGQEMVLASERAHVFSEVFKQDGVRFSCDYSKGKLEVRYDNSILLIIYGTLFSLVGAFATLFLIANCCRKTQAQGEPPVWNTV